MKYVIITPAYNEAAHIRKTLESVIRQTILPEQWVIVDDCSNDTTAEIVSEYVQRYPWIKLVHKPKTEAPFGENVVRTFNYGLNYLDTDDYQFIVKLDADLEIDRDDFFAYQFQKMDKDSGLGICSGLTYSMENGQKVLTTKRPYWHTGGAMKVYRRQCFDAIGGLVPMYGWDGLDEYKAMCRGWKTRTFFDLHVNHLGKKRAVNREKTGFLSRQKGISLYRRGYPVEFIVIRFFNMLFRLKVSAALSFIRGFLDASGDDLIERVVTKEEKKFTRKFQYLRIRDTYSRRRTL